MNTLLRLLGIVFLMSASAGAQTVYAQNESAADRFYSIEFLKPAGGAADLKVHFSSPVAPESVSSVLNQELREAIAFSGRRTDILAVGLLNETRLPLPDGSTFLVYNAANDKIIGGKPYYAAIRPRPAAQNALQVNLDVGMEVNSKGLLRIVGTTNLPGGTCGMLELRCAALGFIDRDSVTVSKGRFASKWFSMNYRSLPPGAYAFSFSTSLPGLQPEKVRVIIGNNGENLSGPYVSDRLADNIVQYENTFVLK